MKKIVSKGVDYVIGLINNQPNLRRDAAKYFEDTWSDPRNYPEVQATETSEKGHGRIEQRKYYLTTKIDRFPARTNGVALGQCVPK